MSQSSDKQMEALLQQLREAPGLAGQLPGREGAIVRDALEGLSVYEIAQRQQLSEKAIWDLLSNAARAASGRPVSPVETGGFGSDTDPGVTGGYGETGFGSLANEPPFPVSEEPQEQDGSAEVFSRDEQPGELERVTMSEKKQQPQGKKHQQDKTNDSPRPSQAEGDRETIEQALGERQESESGGQGKARERGGKQNQTNDPPRPSQAEGDRETIDESLKKSP